MKWRRLLSIGCIVVIIGCGLFTYWTYRQLKQVQNDLQSPSVGQAVLQDLLPGTTFPDPYRPVGGVHVMGVSVAMVMPAGTKGGHTLTVMVMGFPPGSKTSPQQMQQIVQQQTGHGDTHLVSSSTAEEMVQGSKHVFEKRVVMQQNVKEIEYIGVLTGQNNQSVVLMAIGAENAFPDKDFQGVLAAVKSYGPAPAASPSGGTP